MQPEATRRLFEHLDEHTGEQIQVLRTFYLSSLNPSDDPTSDHLIPFPHLEEGEGHLEKANGEIAIVRLARHRSSDDTQQPSRSRLPNVTPVTCLTPPPIIPLNESHPD
jgi:hypothetical protein